MSEKSTSKEEGAPKGEGPNLLGEILYEYSVRTEYEISVHPGETYEVVEQDLQSGYTLLHRLGEGEAAADKNKPTDKKFVKKYGWVPSNRIKVIDVAKTNKKRQKIIAEILSTEKSYLESLQVLVDLWSEPLQMLVPKALSQDDLELLFRNLPELLGLHQDFHDKLLKRMQRWSKQPEIGDLFIESIQKMRTAYPKYVNNHEDAIDLIKTLENSPRYEKFQNHARQCREHPKSKGLGLAALLITPIQRIPRYRLLLQEVVKKTWRTHSDYKNLNTALALVKDVAMYINEELRSSENRLEISRIQSQLIGYGDGPKEQSLHKPGRVFIRKGNLMRVCRHRDKATMFFLFNDCIIYATKKGWKFQQARKLPINETFRLKDLEDRKQQFPWKLDSETVSVVCYTKDQREKQSWMEDIERALSPYQAETLQMGGVIFQNLATCFVCNCCYKKFGLLLKKHHCRNCGHVICNKCSMQRMRLPNQIGIERVCNSCVTKLAKEGVNPPLSDHSGPASRLLEAGEGVDSGLVAAQPASPRHGSGGGDGEDGPAKEPELPATKPPQRYMLKEQSTKAADKAKKDSKDRDNKEWKDWAWLKHKASGYTPAKFLRTVTKGKEMWKEYRTIDGEVLLLSPEEKATPADPTAIQNTILGEIDDLVHLDANEFSEAAMLFQLRARYRKDYIYTGLGGILVAINPFKQIPIYTAKLLQRYAGVPAHELVALPPHVFAVAAKAFAGVTGNDTSSDTGRDQCIVITGESGSGKTETTKLILQYLSEVAGDNEDEEEELGKEDASPVAAPRDSIAARALSGFESLDHELLQSNPFLEAFGCAKTIRNDNSSRFGKFMAVQFNKLRIAGGSVTTYLLETTRVVSQGLHERNFHIFYQLTSFAQALKKLAAGAKVSSVPGQQDKELAALANMDHEMATIAEFVRELGMKPAHTYHYLNQSECYEVKGMNEVEALRETVKSLLLSGLTVQEVCHVFRLVAGVLMLGNIECKSVKRLVKGRMQRALTVDIKACEAAAIMLQLPGSGENLITALEKREVKVTGKGGTVETSTVNMSDKEALAARDTLAKILYSRLFDFMADKLNAALYAKGQSLSSEEKAQRRTIGILDIFGFESFKVNSLEQFFINYTNEKLQKHFNDLIFADEQAAYKAEGISVEHIYYRDNQPCLTAIEARPAEQGAGPDGILGLLDLHKKDQSFYEALQTAFKANSATDPSHYVWISQSKHEEEAEKADDSSSGGSVGKFTIRHYAGQVEYETAHWVAKNQRDFSGVLQRVLAGSTCPLVRELCTVKSENNEAEGKEATHHRRNSLVAQLHKQKSQADLSVGAVFQDSLNTLIKKLREAEPHFIRCIKPNRVKKSHHFDSQMVLRQVKAAGLVEALRIRRSGFPYRLLHEQFYATYALAAHAHPAITLRAANDGKPTSQVKQLFKSLHACEWLREVQVSGFHLPHFRMGKTKVFFTSSQHTALEALRAVALERNPDLANTPLSELVSTVSDAGGRKSLNMGAGHSTLPRGWDKSALAGATGVTNKPKNKAPRRGSGDLVSKPGLDRAVSMIVAGGKGGQHKRKFTHRSKSRGSILTLKGLLDAEEIKQLQAQAEHNVKAATANKNSPESSSPSSSPAPATDSSSAPSSASPPPSATPSDSVASSDAEPRASQAEAAAGEGDKLVLGPDLWGWVPANLEDALATRNKAEYKDALLPCLRQTGDAAASLLKYQKTNLGETLTKLPSKELEDEAKEVFFNLLSYCRDRFNAYPATCALNVIHSGFLNQGPLQDEIYVQMIKQATGCPRQDKALLVWKLIFLALPAFLPASPGVCKSLLSFVAGGCGEHLSAQAGADKEEVKFQSVEQIAEATLKVLFAKLSERKANGVTGGSEYDLVAENCPVTVDHIEALTERGVEFVEEESDDENGNEVDFNEHRAVDASDQHAEEWEALVPVEEVAEEVDLGIGMQQGKLVVPAGLLPPSHSHSDRIVLTPKAGSPVAPNRSLHWH